MTPNDDAFREKSQQIFHCVAEEFLYGLITQRTGIALREFQMPVFRQALADACKKFGYRDTELLYASIQQQDSSPEFEFLLTRVTIGESYFFRHAGQITLLRDQLLPELIARKRRDRDHSIRIWSAGCANGQEIYSMVILLHELLPDIADWKLHFLATDINKVVLANAIHGCYNEWSLRDTPKAMVEKYFSKRRDEYRLRDEICRQVKFAYLNLAEDVFPALHNDTNAIDIILCRNVFIYLETASIRRIMNRFSDCLVPDGLLFLGPSDFFDGDSGKFEYIQLDKAAYLKRKSDNRQERPLPMESFAGGLPKASESSDPVKEIHADTVQPADYLRAGHWHEALLAADNAIQAAGESAALLQIKSKALANLGRLDEALQSCRRSLTLNPVDKQAYLLQGTILVEGTQLREAEECLRKAIFLDHTFSEAHYQLGLLLIQQGKREAGLKCLSHALRHAGKALPHLEVHNAPGMSYQRFAEIVQNEMSIYAGRAAGAKQ